MFIKDRFLLNPGSVKYGFYRIYKAGGQTTTNLMKHIEIS
jgi:hypothetical protein